MGTSIERRKPRPHLRHDPAGRRAVTGHLAQHRREGRDRAAAGAARRRRDRGRLPDHLAGRLRGRRGDLARRRGPDRSAASPAPTRPTSTPPGGRSAMPSGRGSTPSSRPPTSTSSTSSRPTARTSRARPGPPSRWPSPTATDVEFSPMDATRADVEFTAEVCAIAVEEGATVINIPDTVGYTTPEEYAAYFRRLYELVPGLTRGRDLGPLPRRPRNGGRQLLRRAAGRRPPGRVRGQRHRRAGRQLLAGGDRDADPHPRGRPRADDRRSTAASWPAPAAWSRA